METFSALLAFCAGNSPITGEFAAQRPVTRGFDVFFDCTWTNSWANNGDTSDLRRHRTHYDVIVMAIFQKLSQQIHGTTLRILVKDSINAYDNLLDCTPFLATPISWYKILIPTIITNALGAVSIRKTVLPGMAIPMLKIRRPNGRLIFNMEIAIRR